MGYSIRIKLNWRNKYATRLLEA